MAAGSAHACALLRGGKVYCWGATEFGALGVEETSSDPSCRSIEKCRPTPAPVPGIENAVRVAAGRNSTCVVLRDGTVKCWGANHYGQLGPATALPASAASVLVPLPGGSSAVDVSLQGETACVVTSAGEVYCWGANSDGVVGKPASINEPTPNKVIASGAISVSVFGSSSPSISSHACALVGLQIQCWGSNAYGQLGIGAGVAGTPTPQTVVASDAGTLFQARWVGVGPEVTCARKQAGDVWCWGNNELHGVVPPPMPPDAGLAHPARIESLPLEVKQQSEDSAVQLALMENGDVWAWGPSVTGSLANGTDNVGLPCGPRNCAAAPEKSPLLTNIARVRNGGVGLALRNDGKLVAWGLNSHAALGHLPGENGDTDTSFPPGFKAGLSPVVVEGLP